MTTVYTVLFIVWLVVVLTLLNVITVVPSFTPWKRNRSVPSTPATVALDVLAPLANARVTNVRDELSKVGCQSDPVDGFAGNLTVKFWPCTTSTAFPCGTLLDVHVIV